MFDTNTLIIINQWNTEKIGDRGLTCLLVLFYKCNSSREKVVHYDHAYMINTIYSIVIDIGDSLVHNSITYIHSLHN